MTQTQPPTTAAPKTTDTALQNKKTQTSKERKLRKKTPNNSKLYTPFHKNIRNLQRTVSAQLEDNPHRVGEQQTNEAAVYMNSVIEEYLKDLLDFSTTLRDTHAKAGHAGKMGPSFQYLLPKHLEAFIRVKHAPKNADLIMETIERHRANMEAADNNADSDA